MRLIAIVSAKGGVGKTTVSANLAIALSDAGHNVLAIDLDPQNALRLHFGMDPGAVEGLASASLAGSSWAPVMFQFGSSSYYLPFGSMHENQRRQFERDLDVDDNWLISNLTALDLPDDFLVVIDTPPGASVYLRQVLQHANFAVTVVLPDIASYASLPAMANLYQMYCAGRSNFLGATFLINQSSSVHQLGRDIADTLRVHGRDNMIGNIQHDQAVGEALAFSQTVIDYDPHSQSSHDFITLAKRVAQRVAQPVSV